MQVIKVIFNRSRVRSQLCLKRDSTLVRHEKDPCKGKIRNLLALNMRT